MLTNTSPHALNNNQVYTSLDFRQNTLPYLNLLGSSVSIDGRAYTIGTTWLPRVTDPRASIPGIELASSLVEAINGTYEYAIPIESQTDSLGRANEFVEAYHTGAIVHICRRSDFTPTISSSVSGVTPTTPVIPPSPSSNPNPTQTTFRVGIATTTPAALASSPCKFFELENLSSSSDLIITNGGISYKLFKEMGTLFYGSPSQYTVSSVSGSVSYQIKLHI